MTIARECPRISVVTVVFNGAATIEATIKSVLSQEYPELEFVIIDGGSTDGTVEIIKRYETGISAWVSAPDKGIYDAMNKALDLITGDFVLFLGCDDLLWGTEILAMAARKMVDPGSVYYGDVIMKRTGEVYDGYFDRSKIAIKNICHQSIFYPRCLYSRNKYSLKYSLLADYEYNLRLFNRFEYLGVTISIFDDSGASSQRADYEFIKDFRGLVVRHLGLAALGHLAAHSLKRRIGMVYNQAKALTGGRRESK